MHLNETSALIIRDFEIETTRESFSEDELLNILSDQIAYMLEYRTDFLMSLMYRLDIDEQKINNALHPLALLPANVGLAQLVLERQKQRVATKLAYRSKPTDDLEGLEF